MWRIGPAVFALEQFRAGSARAHDAQNCSTNGQDGGDWICDLKVSNAGSPPPRDSEAQEAVWAGLKDGTFQTFSSDHAPYQFNAGGKIPKGDKTTFKEMANGVPGLEVRMPLLFSEGVQKGRITLQQFVALSSTNPAKIYGLHPRKGTIAVGADADIVLWDPTRKVSLTNSILHHNCDYTPYEGRELTGYPIMTLSRGEVVMDEGKMSGSAGRGLFQKCDRPEAARPRGRPLIDPSIFN